MRANLIHRIETYDAGKMSNAQLSQDWMIAIMWWSAIKAGKKLKYSREQVLGVAKKIKHEIDRRVADGKMVHEFNPPSEAGKELLKLLAYTPIFHGSVSRRGSEITLEEVLGRLNDFKIRSPLAWVVGSLANWERTDGDVDILINASSDEPLFHVVNFRILRAFPPSMRDRIHCLPNDNRLGPFTSCVPIYELHAVAGKRERLEMSFNPRDQPGFDAAGEISLKENKIELFRPFFMQKPTHGRSVDEIYSIGSVIRTISLLKWDGQIDVEIKRDGTTAQAHKKGNEVKIWTEQGTLMNLPQIQAEIASHKDDFIVIGELELFIDGVHQPRAAAAGILNSDADKSNIRLTLYDKVYMNGDIHGEPFFERRKKLEMLKESEHVKINPKTVININDNAIQQAINKAAHEKGSEGAMIKLMSGKYELDRKTTNQIKFKNEREIIARVKNAHVLKNPSGNMFNYDMEVDGSPYVGKTYNTIIKAAAGDKLKVVFVDISEYHDGKTVWFNWWAPRAIQKMPANEKTTSIEELHKMVMETTGRIQDKPVPKEFSAPLPEGVKTLERIDLGDIHIAVDPKGLVEADAYVLTKPNEAMMKGTAKPVFATQEVFDAMKDAPFEDINLIEDGKIFDVQGVLFVFQDGKVHAAIELAKKYRYVLQLHFRGKSVTDRTPIIIRRNGKISVIPIKDVMNHSEREKEKIMEKEIEGIEAWTSKGWSDIKWVMRHKQDGRRLKRIRCHEGMVEVSQDHSLFADNKPIKSDALNEGNAIDMDELPAMEGKISADKELAWLYGLYLAEGNEKHGGIEISNNDKRILEKAGETAKKYGFKAHYFSGGENGWKVGINIPIAKMFETSGVHEVAERKARWKIVPEFVFDWDKETQKAFLEGYLEGDGICIDYEKGNIEWASASQSVAQGILLIARRIFTHKYFSIVCQDAVVRVALRDEHNLTEERNIIKEICENKDQAHYGEDNQNFQDKQKGNKHPKKGEWYYSAKRWLYDIETENHDFCAGVGRIKAHNSVHGDFRFEKDDHLEGFTLAVAEPDTIKKPVLNLEEARAAMLNGKFKMDFASLAAKTRTGGEEKISATPKAHQPKVWLDMSGATDKTEPGEPIPVGATRNFPGVFLIVRKGLYEPGADKPDFKEYFTQDGRIVFRFIPGLSGMKWEYWKPQDQTPYVLSDRAVSIGWMPPVGQSALPSTWEKKIPQEYRFWEHGGKAKITRDSLVPFLKEKKELSQEKFVFSRRSWKGATVIRDMPVTSFYLKFGKYKFSLGAGNPLFEAAANAEQIQENKFFEPGSYPPGSAVNPNKRIPATIQIADSGDITIIEESELFLHVDFHGKYLKGRWAFKRGGPNETLWDMEKSRPPQAAKAMGLADLNFIAENSSRMSRRQLAEKIGFAEKNVWNAQKNMGLIK